MSATVDDVVTIKYAAKALGVTPAALYLAIKEDRVESRKVLDRITIPRREFDRLKRRQIKRAKQSNGNGHK
jgi:phosphoribosylaminoimidazole carboxylase (NCAIR synthetase)